eukprot:2314341-Pyramimonas_sp.AAC.1
MTRYAWVQTMNISWSCRTALCAWGCSSVWKYTGQSSSSDQSADSAGCARLAATIARRGGDELPRGALARGRN